MPIQILPAGFSAYGIEQTCHKCKDATSFPKRVESGNFVNSARYAIYRKRHELTVTHALCTGFVRSLTPCYPKLGTDTTGPFVYLLSLPPFQRNSAEEPSITTLHQTPARPGNHFPRLLVFNTQCIINQIPHPDREKIEQLIAWAFPIYG